MLRNEVLNIKQMAEVRDALLKRYDRDDVELALSETRIMFGDTLGNAEHRNGIIIFNTEWDCSGLLFDGIKQQLMLHELTHVIQRYRSGWKHHFCMLFTKFVNKHIATAICKGKSNKVLDFLYSLDPYEKEARESEELLYGRRLRG